MVGVVGLPDPSGAIGRLLYAAEAVQKTAPASALVGGVAVICRLATAHRPTLDADTVAEERDPSVLELLRTRPDTREPDDPRVHGLRIRGALVEIVEVGEVVADDLRDIDDGKDRLFVAAHRWALDTAEPVDVGTDPPTQTRRLRIATPAALAATKTHALVGRRGGRTDKVGSDLLDLLYLFEQYDRRGVLTAELWAAPYHLGHLVRSQLAGLLADPQRRTRSVRLAQQAFGLDLAADRLHTAWGHLLDHG